MEMMPHLHPRIAVTPRRPLQLKPPIQLRLPKNARESGGAQLGMAAAAAACLAAGDLLAGSSNAIQSAAGLNVSDRDGHFEVDDEHARDARNGSAGDSIHVDTPHLGGLSESTFSENGTATGNVLGKALPA
jgi:hypothetical protein